MAGQNTWDYDGGWDYDGRWDSAWDVASWPWDASWNDSGVYIAGTRQAAGTGLHNLLLGTIPATTAGMHRAIGTGLINPRASKAHFSHLKRLGHGMKHRKLLRHKRLLTLAGHLANMARTVLLVNRYYETAEGKTGFPNSRRHHDRVGPQIREHRRQLGLLQVMLSGLTRLLPRIRSGPNPAQTGSSSTAAASASSNTLPRQMGFEPEWCRNDMGSSTT